MQQSIAWSARALGLNFHLSNPVEPYWLRVSNLGRREPSALRKTCVLRTSCFLSPRLPLPLRPEQGRGRVVSSAAQAPPNTLRKVCQRNGGNSCFAERTFFKKKTTTNNCPNMRRTRFKSLHLFALLRQWSDCNPTKRKVQQSVAESFPTFVFFTLSCFLGEILNWWGGKQPGQICFHLMSKDVGNVQIPSERKNLHINSFLFFPILSPTTINRARARFPTGGGQPIITASRETFPICVTR